ncbi:MAG: PAS domain S-box protein, partial [Chitinophagaceae bacterium]
MENQVLLSQMNGLFDAFINQFPHAALVENAENQIIFINEQFCQLFNIPIPAYELVGKDHNLIEKLTEDIIAHADTFFSELSQIISAQITRKEITVELIDGRVFQLDFLPLLLDNQYIGHTLSFKNITDEILANKRLQAQQRLFETILNKLPVDVAVFSPDFSDLFLNPIAIKDTEMRKWMLDWLIGKDMHPHTRIPLNNAGNRRYFNQVLQTKNLVSWEEERENLATNTTEYYLRNMFPVLDEWGEIIMVIGYNINITDRKVAEEKIKISEKKYRDLINYSNTLICTHKLNGEILTVNPAVSLLLKYTKNEMVGNLVQTFLTEKGRDKFESDYIQKVVGKGSSSGVFSIVSKNNEKFYLLFQNYIVFEDAEEPYIVLFAQDITDRIRAEKELLLAKKLTEEAALAKEAFLANMSHEIRTPMNGILGISSFLKKTTLNQQQHEYLQLIIDSANNLLVIVNDVLDIEKIASGKLQLEHIPFKFFDKLKSAVQAFQYKAEEKGLQLVF